MEIEYKDRFIAFLDVLGFKKMVMSQEYKKINFYVNEVEFMVSNFEKIIKENGIDVKIGYIIISDSIIISAEKAKEFTENIFILSILCTTIGTLQAHLSVQDIWLRGAISSGQAYFDSEKNQVIGKAYIDAYLIESELLSNPQVVLDNKIINDFKLSSPGELIKQINNFDKDFTTLHNWKTDNYIKKDFPLFIDYYQYYSNYKDLKIIEEVVSNIEKNVSSDIRLYSKFKWVANYFLSNIKDDTSSNFFTFKERLEKI